MCKIMERLISARLDLGKSRYGHGVRSNDDTRTWGTKRNSWIEMAEEEILDAIIYIAADYIRKYHLSSETMRDDNDLIMILINNPESIVSSYHQHTVTTLKKLLEAQF